ncbi:MAG: hypothetical protein M0005_03530 [Actinomycetota bacterium]|nr:hypothetical protein [Actinomycetota bacterium]
MPARKPARVPPMVRGTVIAHRRRCGKPNCRCVSDEAAHQSMVLCYSEASRTKFVMLPAEKVEPVRRATEEFRRAKARLMEQGNAGLAELLSQLKGPTQAG